MTTQAEESLRKKLAEMPPKRTGPPPPGYVEPLDPGEFGRRVARELFDEYLKESQEREQSKKTDSDSMH